MKDLDTTSAVLVCGAASPWPIWKCARARRRAPSRAWKRGTEVSELTASLADILVALGLVDRLADLIDIRKDELGLKLTCRTLAMASRTVCRPHRGYRQKAIVNGTEHPDVADPDGAHSDARLQRPCRSRRELDTCWSAAFHTGRGRASSRPSPSDPAWTENPRAFAVQPTFPLGAGQIFTAVRLSRKHGRRTGRRLRRCRARQLGAAGFSNARIVTAFPEFEYLTLSDDTLPVWRAAITSTIPGRCIRDEEADAVPRLSRS